MRSNQVVDLASDLGSAIERGETRVHYLPLVRLCDGRVVGVEALARWHRADQVRSTHEFLHIAEKTGHIVAIGRWVMERAIGAVAEWNAAHSAAQPLRVAVNVSRQQLTEPDAIDHLQHVLRASGLGPGLLSIEVGESALLELGHAMGPTFSAMKGLGVRISVDDFGTGASALVALQRYALDELKIDRSLIDQMDVDHDAAAIVRGVVRLAQSLGLETVAEGVERLEQVRVLQGLRCDVAQGWLYAKPAEDLAGAVASAAAAAQEILRSGPVVPQVLWQGPPTPLADHDVLAARVAELSAANDRLADLASNLAHDLMQPVAALEGFLSLLERDAAELDQEHRDWLLGAIRGADRMRQVIGTLYRNAADGELDLVAVDLVGVVEELLQSLARELGDAEVVIGDLPMVLGDAGLVNEVLANLLQNASRYRHDERSLVVVLDGRVDGPSWIVSVTDSGRGISTDELETVFEPGQRGRAAAGTDGTGTGLAIVRTLMRRMGGDAWAQPEVHGGVRMCLRFGAPPA